MQQDRIKDIIRGLGIQDIEIDVYLTLLKRGICSASSVATALGIKRTTIYPILNRLVSLELAGTYHQNSRKVFVATKPNHLFKQYEKKVEALERIVPQLEEISKSEVNKIMGVKFIQSKKEFRALFENILIEYRNKEYYSIGNTVEWLKLDPEFLINFRKERAKQKTRVKLILTHNSKNALGQNDPNLLRQYKYLPEHVHFKSTIYIYSDKIVILGPEIKALCAVVAIPPMVDVFKSIFETLWNKL